MTSKIKKKLKLEMISITDINLPFSPICLLLLYTVCCEEIKSGSAGHLSERDFHIIFRSTFNKDNLLIHHYVCHFVCFSENRMSLLWLNFPKKNASWQTFSWFSKVILFSIFP